jgi:hypothetical protein
MGFPGMVGTSFAGSLHSFSKVIVIVVMIAGRHRGLPFSVDPAVNLTRQVEKEILEIRRFSLQRGRGGGGEGRQRRANSPRCRFMVGTEEDEANSANGSCPPDDDNNSTNVDEIDDQKEINENGSIPLIVLTAAEEDIIDEEEEMKAALTKRAGSKRASVMSDDCRV